MYMHILHIDPVWPPPTGRVASFFSIDAMHCNFSFFHSLCHVLVLSSWFLSCHLILSLLITAVATVPLAVSGASVFSSWSSSFLETLISWLARFLSLAEHIIFTVRRSYRIRQGLIQKRSFDERGE